MIAEVAGGGAGEDEVEAEESVDAEMVVLPGTPLCHPGMSTMTAPVWARSGASWMMVKTQKVKMTMLEMMELTPKASGMRGLEVKLTSHVPVVPVPVRVGEG